MKDQLLFSLSAYLLFALFLTVHIFTDSIIAELIAVFFGISILMQLVNHYKEYIKEVLYTLKSRFNKIIRDSTLH